MQARSSNAEDIIPAVRVWGPIKAAQATAAGALAAASSVLLKPLQPPPELLDQVRALIPSTVLPHKDDDAAETLKRRVQASSRPSSIRRGFSATVTVRVDAMWT